MNRCLILLGVVNLAVLNGTSARAVYLAITNTGFEDPALAVNVFISDGIVGWLNSSCEIGSWRPNSGGCPLITNH